MDAATKIGLGLLILLLLPAMVAEWEGTRLADRFHVALAAGGIVFAAATGGAPAAIAALFAGLAYLMVLGAVIAGVAAMWKRRLLTGGHIKLFSASATWLGFAGGGAMLVLAMFMIITFAVTTRVITSRTTRPAAICITSLSVIATFIGMGAYK